MTKKEKDQFNKFMIIIQSIGVLFFLAAVYVFMNGIPNFESQDRYVEFCFSEGGQFWPRTRDTHNMDLCSFTYEGYYSDYAMEEITNKDWAEATGHTVGELCFVCWDSQSCERDTLTKIDNGTRRYTRC